MPIKFVTGKPGGGKGLRLIRLIWEHLQMDERLIVTNLPINLENLQDYAIAHGREDIHVPSRIRLLLPAQEPDLDNEKSYRMALRDFFTYRTLGKSPDPLPSDEDYDIDFPGDRIEEDGEFVGYRGCVFFIDEIHKLYPARAYQKTSTWILKYLAEHRHFGDDVYFATQFLAQVDKQVRLMAQDYEVIRNRGKEKIMIFSGSKSFGVYTYLEPPGPSTSHVTSSSFRLDPGGLCECYDTASRGGGADKGRYARGIPWWVMYAMAGAAAAAVWLVVVKGPALIMRQTKDAMEREPTISASAFGLPGRDRRPEPEPDPASPGLKPDIEKPVPAPVSDPLPKITGLVTLSDRVMVWFSDGTSNLNGRLTSLDSRSAVVDGQRFLFQKKGFSSAAPVPGQ